MGSVCLGHRHRCGDGRLLRLGDADRGRDRRSSFQAKAGPAGISELRRELVGLLARHGLSPLPSDANFVLCPAPTGFRDKLLGQGIVVRDCASFGLVDHVRIAVPDSQGIDRLSAALEAVTP